MTNEILKYEFLYKIQTLSFVKKIILFGSRSRNDHFKKADIDIAILCTNNTTKQWIEIMDIIDHADTLLKIDCVNLNDLPVISNLKKNIEEEGIVLYEKN